MKIEHKIEVRFRDVDSMGHVNNAVYLSYFEQARMTWFKELVGFEWNWMDAGILVARHEIDYKRPISLNDEITISTWCESMGNSSLVMAYEIMNGENILYTQGKTVIVCFDYNKQSPCLIPAEWRDKIKLNI